MSVIGLGKAYRDQSRAAEASRTRRTPRGERSPDELCTPAVAEACHLCGRTDFVVESEDGPTCLACQAPPEPSPTEGLWMEALLPLAGLLLTLVVFGVIPIPPGSKRLGVWAVAYGMGMVAALIALPSGARLAGSPHPQAARVGRVVAGVSGLELVALAGLMAWAVLRALLG